ncbi:hypothetical protein MWH28_07320 [Natroniella sulfidigena]|uniref:hypothetical protein n=1 Tax=Natroniella sulfidigena TaxID=723921 RepID=UPI00200A76FD|nr:hypothetical protein [Natroniella sulfidigena]MCK8817169.1 hypothetical protein [Natroniella sulfidigena]
MKFDTWKCGVLAGLIATVALVIITATLDFFDLLAVSETEYAARFILHSPERKLVTLDWIVGVITNFSLGALFGLISAFFYKYTGLDERYFKIIGIAVLLWFFHLAIVPFLAPRIRQLNTAQTAIEFYFMYIFWSFIASSFIFKYLKF